MPGSESLVHKTAHKEAGAFLKALITHLESEQHRELCDNLAKAEREEKCLRHGVFLMVVLLMISVVGLGYCALLLPEIFNNPTHPFMRSLSVLGLGSLISQVVFLGYLFWHRTVVTRLHAECRRLILTLARSQFKVSAPSSLAVGVETQSPADCEVPLAFSAPAAGDGHFPSMTPPNPHSQKAFGKSS